MGYKLIIGGIYEKQRDRTDGTFGRHGHRCQSFDEILSVRILGLDQVTDSGMANWIASLTHQLLVCIRDHYLLFIPGILLAERPGGFYSV